MMNSIINQTNHKNKNVKVSTLNLNLHTHSDKNKHNNIIMNTNGSNMNSGSSVKNDTSVKTFNSDGIRVNGKIDFGAMLQRIAGMRGGCSSCGKKK